jgi:hypothetical protein
VRFDFRKTQVKGTQPPRGRFVVDDRALFKVSPPPNDNFAAAQPVTGLPAQYSLFTAGATTEMGEPACHGALNTVWYSYSPAATTKLTVDTDGSDYGATVAVYTGNAVNALLIGP